MLPVLKTACCGCCSLRTGSILIAVFCAIGNIGHIITCITKLVNHPASAPPRQVYALVETVTGPSEESSTIISEVTLPPEVVYNEEADYRAVYIIVLFLHCLHLLGNVLLIMGADKGKAQWVKYAVSDHLVTLVMSAIVAAVFTILLQSFIFLIVALLYLAFIGYYWLILYSFYWQLIEAAMTETQAQLETSSLTKPTEYSTEEERQPNLSGY